MEDKTKELGELIREINSHFKPHKNLKYSTIMWDLRCWRNGYWSVDIIDDWHKWLDKGIKLPNLSYLTPELACMEFLKFIKENKLNIKGLQSR